MTGEILKKSPPYFGGIFFYEYDLPFPSLALTLRLHNTSCGLPHDFLLFLYHCTWGKIYKSSIEYYSKHLFCEAIGAARSENLCSAIFSSHMPQRVTHLFSLRI